MKIIYTILFFADTLLLVVVSFGLLKMIDDGISIGKLVLMVLAIGVSIGALILLLKQYLKLPASRNNQ